MKENYNDLYAFLMVAKEGSFTKAASKLNLSQSALSHSIKSLEERLGLLLLTRTTRSISPTEVGRNLLQTLSQSFGEIEEQLSVISAYQEKPTGTVKINASNHAISKILIPKLKSLPNSYADIKIELVANSGMVDIVAEGFDAGVRFGNRVADGMIAVRIGKDVKMVVVGSPEYFSKTSLPQEPKDLYQHTCIGFRLTTKGNLYIWEFQNKTEVIKIKVNPTWIFNESYQSLKAACMGLGVAYLPEDLVQNHLKNKTLISVLEPYSITFPGYHLYYPHRRQKSFALKVVIDALKVKN